jgi:hypothetical protein
MRGLIGDGGKMAATSTVTDFRRNCQIIFGRCKRSEVILRLAVVKSQEKVSN